MTTPPQDASPLTTEQLQQLAAAGTRAKKIRSAARVAVFNGYVTASFAFLSAPLVPVATVWLGFVPSGLVGLLVTVGLAVIAYGEFRGRRMLLAFEPKAAGRLGWNQIGFLGLITGYCLWSIVQGWRSNDAAGALLWSMPELRPLLESPEVAAASYLAMVLLVYGSVIVLSIIFLGLNAIYYFTRRKHIETYLRDTPPWVTQVLRATSGL